MTTTNSQSERLNAAFAGRYVVERELGTGGMATVYLADDIKHDRKVAVKVLKPELAAVLGGERFVVEIKTTASLSHPHILPLFDSGSADGFLLYVMPFIEGETIRDKLNRETQFGIEEAVRIARDVANRVQFTLDACCGRCAIWCLRCVRRAPRYLGVEFGAASSQIKTIFMRAPERLFMMSSYTLTSLIGVLAFVAASASAQPLLPVGDTVTTASGLRYVFVKHGTGPAPASGDVMVMHGIGRFASGKEFWNTRTTNEPFEYVVGFSGVIRGFGEGMLLLHEGDRVKFIMKPELAYDAKGITGIPPNSTLVFDYEILAVHPLSITRLLREGVMNIDSTITAARALPNLKDYYVSEETMLDDATKLSWAAPGDKEKILKFGISLLPNSHELRQALAKLRAK